ncbi:MAG: tandem-95 repeat protein, partial [Gammaproteobacteria bacterium]
LPTSADSSVVTVENIAITFAASDFVFSDLETATIDSLRIDSLPGNGVLQNGAVLLNPGDVVLAADLDNLTYTPNTNFNGSDSFTFSVSDGTDYSVNPNTMTITVSAVNNVPSSMDSMTSTNEDQAWTFTAADFPFADVESASIVALRIDALPTNGVLMNGATAINAGDVIVAANLSNLSFTPAADFNGTDSFAFSVFDGIDYSAAPNTMTITVNAINDIPNSGDFSISTMEDASLTFAVSDFPFADAENAGIVALRIDTIPANGVLMNGTTVVNAGDVIVAADLANLSYTPTAGFNGADSFSFSVSDGTAYSSAPSTLTANVNPATVVTPVYVPPIDPPVVVRPDLPVQVSMSVVDPVVTETAVQEVDTVTEGVTEDETTPEEKPAQAAVSEAIPVFPGDPGVQGPDAPPDYDSNQRVGVDSSVKVNMQSLLQAIKIQLPGWDNLLLGAGDLFEPMNLLERDDFNRNMDQLREDAAEDMVSRQMTAGTGVVLTTSLTIGYVAYLVRGGVLLSSVLSALPVWSFIDPTPILASMKNGDDDDSDADDSLESLVTQD